jgi:hypothetical protein
LSPGTRMRPRKGPVGRKRRGLGRAEWLFTRAL